MLRIPRRRGFALLALALILGLVGASAPLPTAAATTRVELIRTGDPGDADALLSVLGAEVELRSEDRIQARVPKRALPVLHRATRLVHLEIGRAHV